MPHILIVGGTRGLGASLTDLYASRRCNVYPTTRSWEAPQTHSRGSSPLTTWITNVDVAKESAGPSIVKELKDKAPGHAFDVVIITAGYFAKESLDEPNFDSEVLMYKTSSIGPVFIVHHLQKANLLKEGSKIILVSSESGSIALRHESEGGGNYGHHASKTALNMVGKLLSLDLKGKGVAVGIVHPGFMRTEMTKGVGFDKFWDAGGAVTPDAAAVTLSAFIESFDMRKTGQYWAPRGPGDIGTVEDVLGPRSELPTPLQLPW